MAYNKLRQQYLADTGKEALQTVEETVLDDRMTHLYTQIPVLMNEGYDKYFTLDYILWLESKVEELSK